MDWNKYNQVPLEWATASDIGLAAATLGAMARRGYVEVLPGKPSKYRRVVTPQVLVYKYLNENEDDYDEFFTLYKADVELGMFCSLDSSGDVVDCWGKKYNLTNVCKIQFRTRSFDL